MLFINKLSNTRLKSIINKQNFIYFINSNLLKTI